MSLGNLLVAIFSQYHLLQGGSQKLLLTTKGSIVSSSIFSGSPCTTYSLGLDIYKMLDKGKFEIFDRLMKADPQLLNCLRDTAFFNKNSSLLMKAVREGKPDMLSKLLEYPQDLSIVDKNCENVFHLATYQNHEWWLDELKKNIHDANELKKLLDNRSKCSSGGTSLHTAALHNNHESIKWLLWNGVDIDATDKNGDVADKQMFGNEETKRLIREYRNK